MWRGRCKVRARPPLVRGSARYPAAARLTTLTTPPDHPPVHDAEVIALDARRRAPRRLPRPDAPVAWVDARPRGDDRVVVVVVARPGGDGGVDADAIAREVARALGAGAPPAAERPRERPVERLGDLELDRAARTLAGADGRRVPLTRTEHDLLCLLLDREGDAVTRDAILDAIWGEDVVVGPRTIDNFVLSLRRKLAGGGDPGVLITAVRGVGYRLERAP
ncbi:MAG: winged helix-turn-helix transcriptional regulator [Deltaproteobacteria bacterium]|nr:winged helix-turn-helix transcriptional regulator [Deltaproteobacteria bacterium]